MAAKKAVDVKKIVTAANDFAKLYNIELSLANGKEDKIAAEKKLLAVIQEEMSKYEHKDVKED